VAADFFTIEAWTRKGLTRFLVLFLIDVSSRRVEIAGVAREANGSVRKAIHEFVLHYHHERNHQGLGNRLIIQEQLVADSAAAVQRRSRLGGMLHYYHRQAA
jgi:hypothetical protein